MYLQSVTFTFIYQLVHIGWCGLKADGQGNALGQLSSPSGTEIFSRSSRPSRASVEAHWQPGNLKEVIRVLQLNVPLDFKYSVVYQKVQSSTGSTLILL